ncbi:unnamed protein product, partial [Owenia fusiformis]
TTKMAAARFVSVDYEVFGRVQGVFFRKYTQKAAKEYGLVGWVKNTTTGTVTGQVQGPRDKVILMKTWLKTKGSKRSRIDKCEFTNEKAIDQLGFTSFDIVK